MDSMETRLHSEAINALLTVGSTFDSFDSLQKTISDFEKNGFVQLYVRSSRTLQVQRKRAPRKTFNEALQFGELDYACINGGRKFKSKSTGQRPNQSTFQMACPFHVKVRTTADGQMLVIKSVHLDHNHEVSPANYSHLPRQRQMNDAEKERTLRFLRLKGDKKIVQQQIREETGKVVTLKDLHNLIGPSRSGVGLNLQDVVSELEKTQGGATIRVVEQNGITDAVFYQRHVWREIYQLFPEMVLIDATCNINNLGMPLYVMLAVDGNGESQVVAVWFTGREDKETMRAMVSIFKELNDTGRTKCFMADKDSAERDVLGEEFPDAALLICLFHTFRTFRREVTEKSMGCSSGEKNNFLEILQKLMYSHSEEQYMVHYQELQATGNPKLLHYFDSNWHPIRKEWVEGMKVEAGHMLNRTNNRLESINQKIKSVVDRGGNLAVSVRELLLYFDSLDQERHHRATVVVQKVPVGVYAPETPVTEYQRLLTPHAFGLLQEQYQLCTDVVVPADAASSASVILHTTEGTLKVSTESCTCSFFKAVSLPCRHVFAVRLSKGLALFDKELCARRWTTSYCRGRLVANETSAIMTMSVAVLDSPKEKAIPSQTQRYSQAFEVARRLAFLASDLPLREFYQAIVLLEQMASAWQGGKKVMIEVVDPPAHSCEDVDKGVQAVPPPAFSDTPPPVSCSLPPSSSRREEEGPAVTTEVKMEVDPAEDTEDSFYMTDQYLHVTFEQDVREKTDTIPVVQTCEGQDAVSADHDYFLKDKEKDVPSVDNHLNTDLDSEGKRTETSMAAGEIVSCDNGSFSIKEKQSTSSQADSPSSSKNVTSIRTGQKPHVCPKCHAAFFRFVHLKQHMLTHTGERPPHQCTQCDAAYHRTASLKRHILTHKGERPHKCQKCDAAFIHSGLLKQHMLKMKHTGERPHQCKQCNATFIHASALKRHILTHTGERPHKCQ